MARVVICVNALLLTFLFSQPSQAMKCEKGVVEVGDSKFEVVHKCGEPTFKETTQVSRITESEGAFEQDFVTVEDWLFNFGADRFVIIVTFEQGEVKGMRPAGYGRALSEEPNPNKVVEIGDPKVVVLFAYGPPTHKEERVEKKVVSLKSGATLPRTILIEEWTYNYGPRRFLRIYRFENGRLKDIKTGDRGF